MLDGLSGVVGGTRPRVAAAFSTGGSGAALPVSTTETTLATFASIALVDSDTCRTFIVFAGALSAALAAGQTMTLRFRVNGVVATSTIISTAQPVPWLWWDFGPTELKRGDTLTVTAQLSSGALSITRQTDVQQYDVEWS